MDIGDRSDSGPSAMCAGALLDRYSWADAADVANLRFFYLVEKLPSVGGEGFDVAPLALGVNGIKY